MRTIIQIPTSAITNSEFVNRYGKQAAACIPTNRVRGYATHPTYGRRKP